MSNGSKSKWRTIITWIAAVTAFIVGMALAIVGFLVPPTGVISGSVLTLVGETMTFFGAVFGIGEYTKIQLAKLKRAGDGHLDEDVDEYD